MNDNKPPLCTLSDAELIAAVDDLVSRLCENPGAWQTCVPADMNKDSDMLICELCNRFKRLTETIKEQDELWTEALKLLFQSVKSINVDGGVTSTLDVRILNLKYRITKM